MSYCIRLDYKPLIYGDYIGEKPVVPKVLSTVIHLRLQGKLLPLSNAFFYFYGAPDKRLKRMFGYDQRTGEEK